MISSEPRDIDSLEKLVSQTESCLVERFGKPASFVVAAPGRVNLIGEHVDYNDGFVLPMAIERYVVIAAAARGDQSSADSIRVHSSCLGETKTIHLDRPLLPGRSGWVSYLEGVVAEFIEVGVSDSGERVPSFDAVIGSSVPLGSGLSSSAALEVAMVTLLGQFTQRTVSRRDQAMLCQRAEHRFAGVPCGIMDQFSSLFGQPGELMLIDCRSQEVQAVPFDTGDVAVLITHCGIRHELAGSQYAIRRGECDTALRNMGKTSWRDVTMELIEQRRTALTDTEYRRARHVVSETTRTIEAARAFRNRDWELAGKLMNGSHLSLRDDYEVSCHELDVLVEIAQTLGRQHGVYGARMTGGGFGGCTVSLVARRQLKSVIDSIMTQYQSATGIKPYCFGSLPARGAHVIQR